MTNTTNYNLLLAEGTDLVNYLTQTNPNFSTLDTVIKGVSDLTVTPATEVTTGTAHAISKTLADATVIKFTATSNWQTGDTMTLDGSPVTPLKTDGTTLKTGDYIIGSTVLMLQDGTRLTVMVASSPDAGDINYDNTVSGLASNKVQGAVDELAGEVNTINSNLITKTTGKILQKGQTYRYTFTGVGSANTSGNTVGLFGVGFYVASDVTTITADTVFGGGVVSAAGGSVLPLGTVTPVIGSNNELSFSITGSFTSRALYYATIDITFTIG